MVRVAAVLVFAGATAGACAPTFDDPTAIVSAPRLLAVQSVPAEVAVGDAFTMRALYVGPRGVQSASGLTWATCLLQAPSDQPGPVNPACFAAASRDVVPLGKGATASGSVPTDACQLFGPDSPPPAPGQPSPRPTDPDATGGYYLPVVVETGAAQWSVAPERITCPPSGVTEDVLMAFSSGYRPNVNPSVLSLSSEGGAAAVSVVAPDAAAGPPIEVKPGQQISFSVTWSSCPSAPQECSGAETYLSVDPTTHAVVALRESMVASWYATRGAFAVDRSGRAEGDLATDAANQWTAPSNAGPVHLWVVLRDSRGGVGWESYTVMVAP